MLFTKLFPIRIKLATERVLEAKAFLWSVKNNNLRQSVEALLFKERGGSMTFAERIFIISFISDNRASRLRDKQRTKEFHLWIINTSLCLSLAERQGSRADKRLSCEAERKKLNLLRRPRFDKNIVLFGIWPQMEFVKDSWQRRFHCLCGVHRTS